MAPFEFPHFFPSLFLQRWFWGSAGKLLSQDELTSVREDENADALASAREDTKGLAPMVTLLEAELVDVHQAREVAEEKFRSFSHALADGEQRLVASEKEHQEQFKELFLLWAWGAELCLATIGPSQVMNHLS
jgi:septal ring factor EnvC (AmiA/AmiB activator)